MATYRAARETAMAQFIKTQRVQALWRQLSLATDQLLSAAGESSGVTLIAVGGYGRRELLPFSDVDVLVVAGDDQAGPVVQLLQQLWDMDVPVSHATRTVEETVSLAQADATIAASLMDARFLCGERKQFLALKKRLKQEVFGQRPRMFVDAKLAEREARHTRFGDSRFVLEPNVKEGKGGLRDLQTLNWLARYCYGTATPTNLVRGDVMTAKEWKLFRQAYVFFSTVRAAMHCLRGRADERLTFDLQTQIAALLKFRGRTPQARAERLMLRYFQFTRAVGTLTRIFCAILEEQHMRTPLAPFANTAEVPEYLRLEHGRLLFAYGVDLMETPQHMIGLFEVSRALELDLHPQAQIAIARALPQMGRSLPLDGESNRLFLQILLAEKGSDAMLRRMNEMGVLAALIPEFGRVTGQMQYDGYHTYTVDEHTLVAVANLHLIESGAWAKDMPLATSLAKDVKDRAVLYLAMLGHDLAKGQGGGHAEKGDAIVQRIAQRLGLSDAEGQLAGFLVKHHLLLSDTAFKRDLDDPKTIEDFVTVVQSPERLRLLLLVTAADIKAVGPSIWNGWKGALMRTLYHRAMAAMGVGDAVAEEHWPEALIARWSDAPVLEVTHDAFRAVTAITCCMAQRPDALKLMAGTMALLGASIVRARIRPVPEALAKGAVLAELSVQNAHGASFADEAKRLAKLPGLLQQVAEGQPIVLPQRKRVARGPQVAVRPAVFIDNKVSAAMSVIEVNAADRLGLLFDMLRAMEELKLQVMSAHIATFGSMAVDVFYVKDAYGHKILHYAKMAETERSLRDAVTEGEE